MLSTLEHGLVINLLIQMINLIIVRFNSKIYHNLNPISRTYHGLITGTLPW